MGNETCEKCGTAPGTAHPFHYGRKAGLPAAGPLPEYRAAVYGNMHSTWTEHYEVGGIDSVVLCRRCLSRARARTAVGRLVHTWANVPLVIVLYLLWAAGVGTWTWRQDWTPALLWFGVGVVATAVAYGVFYVMLRDDDFAQRTAVELHERRLREQGWDVFWTAREFTSLTPH
jgi:hypothetical protein